MQALSSRLSVGDLALASVHAVCVAARHPRIDAALLDPDRIAAAYRSDRYLLVDGERPDVWAGLSGFWSTGDGWIRTHGNYPHHARALRRAMNLASEDGAYELRAELLGRASEEVVQAVTAAGGLAVAVRREEPAVDAALRLTPLVETHRIGDAAPRAYPQGPDPLSGIRVLDLTRVIAGPVCTRTLALLGADVLRIDPPGLPESEWQHLDTGHGKRSAVSDTRSEQFAELLGHADVVVLGYRPAALDRRGLSPEAISERHPGIVVAQLCAWGFDQPDRRGFDSLVQAESGIAMIESSDGELPGALPAQALDHSAGYLLAAAVISALRRRSVSGGSWLARTSLRRVAAELLGMPRRAEPQEAHEIDVSAHTQSFEVGGHRVTTARSAIPGFEFAPPRPWGRDAPHW
ncbi:CoA transferase [Microbacterium tumbae]